MKRIFFIFAICIIMVLFSITSLAKSGDTIGNIYSTDILAFINDVPVISYCLDGKTAIILEDLAQYGINSYYNDETQTFEASAYSWNYALSRDSRLQPQVSRGTVGRIVGRIYETDIKISMNGVPISGFLLDGKVAVTIEDLGEITEDGAEYSPYNMRCAWDGEKRTISLYFLYDNREDVIYRVIGFRPISLTYFNDTISFYIDHFVHSYGGSYTDFNPPTAQFPLYYGNQNVGIGFKYILRDGSLDYGRYYDLEAMRKIVNEIEIRDPTYEEVLKYYEEDPFLPTYIMDRIDTDDYSFLYIDYATPRGGTQSLVRIDRNGTYKDYTYDFESVSLYGTKTFDNVKIDTENEIVTFSYDGYYIIDLKSGILYKK